MTAVLEGYLYRLDQSNGLEGSARVQLRPDSGETIELRLHGGNVFVEKFLRDGFGISENYNSERKFRITFEEISE